MLTVFALTSLGFAADTDFSETKKDGAAVEEPEARLTAELGGALTTGNSEFYTLTGGVNGSYRWQRSQLAIKGGAIVGSSRIDGDGDGTLSEAEREEPMAPNARRLYADGRYDLFLSANDSLYLLAGAYTDRFAGFDLRTHEQIGYSRLLVKNDSTSLVGELGFDVAQENYIEGVEPNTANIFAARGMLAFTHKFSESVGIEDTFEIYENVVDPADLRILNSASLVSALSSKLSLKLSHNLIFDNRPVGFDDEATATFRKLDQTMQVTLVASIL